MNNEFINFNVKLVRPAPAELPGLEIAYKWLCGESSLPFCKCT